MSQTFYSSPLLMSWLLESAALSSRRAAGRFQFHLGANRSNTFTNISKISKHINKHIQTYPNIFTNISTHLQIRSTTNAISKVAYGGSEHITVGSLWDHFGINSNWHVAELLLHSPVDLLYCWSFALSMYIGRSNLVYIYYICIYMYIYIYIFRKYN